jgi:hypothetical protein
LDSLKRYRIGIFIIVSAALLSSSLTLRQEIRLFRKSPKIDQVTSYEKKFTSLKAILPPHSVVGFATDFATTNYGEGAMERFIAQYTLAPVLISNDSSRPLVIGSFRNPSELEIPLSNSDLIPLASFENGVMLLKNRKLK